MIIYIFCNLIISLFLDEILSTSGAIAEVLIEEVLKCSVDSAIDNSTNMEIEIFHINALRALTNFFLNGILIEKQSEFIF